MFTSWKIARLFDIDVQIHWTFWLLPLWVLGTGVDSAWIPPWLNLLALGALFACIVMHEFGHALTARQFGIRTRSITLTPLGGIAALERMSPKPWEEFCIAIAGPLVNVAISLLLGFSLAGLELLGFDLESSLLMRFLTVLLALNLMIVVFNMIPAFPMDGGRVLRAILANSLGLLEGTRVAVAIGTVAAIGMGFAGAFWLGNPWLILIGVFVVFTGLQELRALEWESRHSDDEAPMARKSPTTHITVCQWDPQRQQWVHRTYDEPASNPR